MLTIGIPTYNRCHRVAGLLKTLCSHSLPEGTRILVIDDGSNDGTQDCVESIAENCDILEFVSHEDNEGYAAKYVELFDRCGTRYLLVTSDDDTLLIDNLNILFEELRRDRADILCTQFLHDGRVYRGRKKFAPVLPMEYFACSAHAPGIVYKVNTCRNGVAEVRALLTRSFEIARLYPQVLVVAYTLRKGSCFWWPWPLAESGAGLPTGLRSSSGQPYYFVSARWRQLREFDTYFSDSLKTIDNPVERRIIETMRQNTRARIYGTLRAAIISELPDAIEEYDRSVRRHGLRLHVKTIVNSVAGLVSGFSKK